MYHMVSHIANQIQAKQFLTIYQEENKRLTKPFIEVT